MVYLCFVVDTSASMTQRTESGVTYLDVVKNGIEAFVKNRSVSASSRSKEKFLLVTTDHPGFCIKSGWKESVDVFLNILRNLRPTGLTQLVSALNEAYDLLNVFRLANGIDCFGMGRNVGFSDHGAVVIFTDSLYFSTPFGTQNEIFIKSSFRGSELYKEPFRWDQKTHLLLLDLPKYLSFTPAPPNSAPHEIPDTIQEIDNAPISLLCDASGGSTHIIATKYELDQKIESIFGKLMQMSFQLIFSQIDINASSKEMNISVVEKSESVNKMQMIKPPPAIGAVLPTASQLESSTQIVNQEIDSVDSSNQIVASENLIELHKRSLNLVTSHKCSISLRGKSVIHWPIPENFWLDHNSSVLQPRDSLPVIYYGSENFDPHTLESLPFDRFELEPSSFTAYFSGLLKSKYCRQCYIQQSGKDKTCFFGKPFGYIKSSSTSQQVNLFVLPYNFPVFIELVDCLVKDLQFRVSTAWKNRFESYLSSIPFYYIQPLKNAWKKMNLPMNLFPDHMDGVIPSPLGSFIKKVKIQAKTDLEAISSMVGRHHPPLSEECQTSGPVDLGDSNCILKPEPNISDFQKVLVEKTVPVLYSEGHVKKYVENVSRSVKNFQINLPSKLRSTFKAVPVSTKSLDTIDRLSLFYHLDMMLKNIYSKKANSYFNQYEFYDKTHSVPISVMGDYQSSPQVQQALREANLSMVRVNTFGNPFKMKYVDQLHVDEADVSISDVPDGNSDTIRTNNSVASPSSSGKRRLQSRRQRFLTRKARRLLETGWVKAFSSQNSFEEEDGLAGPTNSYVDLDSEFSVPGSSCASESEEMEENNIESLFVNDQNKSYNYSDEGNEVKSMHLSNQTLLQQFPTCIILDKLRGLIATQFPDITKMEKILKCLNSKSVLPYLIETLIKDATKFNHSSIISFLKKFKLSASSSSESI